MRRGTYCAAHAVMPALLSASLCLPAAAEDRAAAPTDPPEVSYWSVWADQEGDTHISRCTISSFELQRFAPPAAPEWVFKVPHAVDNLTFAVQPKGWTGEWHKNPKPQWIVPLSGRWFVETTDGHRVEMGPGEASFGGDRGAREVDGKIGHRSGTIGDAPAVLMVVQLRGTTFAAGTPVPSNDFGQSFQERSNIGTWRSLWNGRSNAFTTLSVLPITWVSPDEQPRDQARSERAL